MIDTNDRQALQRKANVRLALTLASVAIIFGIGFVAKVLLFGR